MMHRGQETCLIFYHHSKLECFDDLCFNHGVVSVIRRSLQQKTIIFGGIHLKPLGNRLAWLMPEGYALALVGCFPHIFVGFGRSSPKSPSDS